MMTYGARSRHNLRLGVSVGTEQTRPDTFTKPSNPEMSPGSTLKWRMHHRSSAASVDCTANDTTSTATTNTEPSTHADYTLSAATSASIVANSTTAANNHSQDAAMEKSMNMRTRTNFGDYQGHVPPEAKPSPHNVSILPRDTPIVAPKRVTPETPRRSSPGRKALPNSLKLPVLPLPSPSGSDANSDRLPESLPSPLAEKRLQFFDDAPADQVPFDQVWNQQEFVLGDDQQQKTSDMGSEDNQEHDNRADDDQSIGTDASKPFDEPTPEKMGPSDYSAFSAYSINSSSTTTGPQPVQSPPQPPPPPPPHSAKQQRKKAPLDPPLPTSSSSPRSPRIKSRMMPYTPTPPGSPRDRRIPIRPPRSPSGEEKKTDDSAVMMQQAPASQLNNYEAGGNDDDIPSDEDESKLSNLSGRSKQNLSLATASKGTAAEDVGSKAEDLSVSGSNTNHMRGKSKSDHDENKSVDSLFDFREHGSFSPKQMCLSPTPLTPKSPLTPDSPSSRSSQKSPGRWRKNAPTELTCRVDDDTSSLDVPTGDIDEAMRLKARAQEAFATRRRFSPKKGTSPRSPGVGSLPLAEGVSSDLPADRKEVTGQKSPRTQKSPVRQPQPQQQPQPQPPQLEIPVETTKTKNVVSFTATDTIHHFQQEYDMYSEQDESAMSMSTFENDKSLGAEVEEAIKDIFMINALSACNPSPPKIRSESRSESRFERRDSGGQSSEEDDTLSGTQSDAPDDAAKAQRRSPDAERSTREMAQQGGQQDDVFFEAMLSMVEGGIGAMTAAFGFATGGPPAVIEQPAEPRSNRALPPTTQNRGRSLQPAERPSRSPNHRPNGPESESVSSDIQSEVPQDERSMDRKAIMEPPTPAQSLEDDPRLLELAKQAALCMHEVLGVHYDESKGVDIGDIKFVVVVLTLPLGLIFQEDYSGCWVTKVMPGGNAALSGRVEPGDQLAAIDSRSSIGMKVDDICDAIAEASSRCKEIELTFLRYVGPFQPLPSDGEPRGVQPKKREGLDDGSSSSRRGSEEMYPSIESTLVEDDFFDDRPQSTQSVTKDEKLNKGQKLKSKKSGSFRKSFKWLNRRGKKRTSKAE
ncbi:expressed unknown protein [Seminavis robusta]|uniref:PDZ domain-containing protein n=1 Tax=Seminavis robusta TaxID=568900 RepID=A0A9N8E5R2_9STRA|nr:expressed unknown protein [Seminavis robusta]|eukprot:Sro649_g181230.1 n/a (1085) ;mRNA; f:34415-37856